MERLTQVQRNARLRAKRRRVDYVVRPDAPEALALDRLSAELGSARKAITAALLLAVERLP